MALALSRPSPPPPSVFQATWHNASPSDSSKSYFHTAKINYSSPAGIHLRRSSFQLSSADLGTRGCRCRALSPGQPPGKGSAPSSGPTSRIARMQESTRIFLAVLFWMALFFWSSVWNGENDDGSSPRKGSRFRR